jgi:hypothetical protein
MGYGGGLAQIEWDDILNRLGMWTQLASHWICMKILLRPEWKENGFFM